MYHEIFLQTHRQCRPSSLIASRTSPSAVNPLRLHMESATSYGMVTALCVPGATAQPFVTVPWAWPSLAESRFADSAFSLVTVSSFFRTYKDFVWNSAGVCAMQHTFPSPEKIWKLLSRLHHQRTLGTVCDCLVNKCPGLRWADRNCMESDPYESLRVCAMTVHTSVWGVLDCLELPVTDPCRYGPPIGRSAMLEIGGWNRQWPP